MTDDDLIAQLEAATSAALALAIAACKSRAA